MKFELCKNLNIKWEKNIYRVYHFTAILFNDNTNIEE